jgi:hypothetical protein
MLFGLNVKLLFNKRKAISNVGTLLWLTGILGILITWVTNFCDLIPGVGFADQLIFASPFDSISLRMRFDWLMLLRAIRSPLDRTSSMTMFLPH